MNVDTKTLLGLLLFVVALLAVLGTITYGVLESGRAKRSELRVCIATGGSPVECRLAVYGSVGRG